MLRPYRGKAKMPAGCRRYVGLRSGRSSAAPLQGRKRPAVFPANAAGTPDKRRRCKRRTRRTAATDQRRALSWWMCSGVVPQQPPKIVAPIFFHFLDSAVYLLGGYSSVKSHSGGSKRPMCA